jgi:hypothetical protein
MNVCMVNGTATHRTARPAEVAAPTADALAAAWLARILNDPEAGELPARDDGEAAQPRRPRSAKHPASAGAK